MYRPIGSSVVHGTVRADPRWQSETRGQIEPRNSWRVLGWIDGRLRRGGPVRRGATSLGGSWHGEAGGRHDEPGGLAADAGTDRPRLPARHRRRAGPQRHHRTLTPSALRLGALGSGALGLGALGPGALGSVRFTSRRLTS